MQTILKLNLIIFQIEINITRFVMELRFFWKFNLFLLPIVLAAYGATSWFFWQRLSAASERAVLDQARIILQTAKGMRTYTTDQITPLLAREQERRASADERLNKILDVDIPEAMKKAVAQLPAPRERQALQSVSRAVVQNAQEEQPAPSAREFLPQSIPFFAATEVFNYFRRQNPDYAYKEAALNPTNPRDRVSDWEMDIVDIFRQDAKKTEFAGRRDTPMGPMLYVSRPIRVDDKTCLSCHGAASDAPKEFVARYGPDNGFGWALNDVVGAQIVSIPEAVAEDRAVAEQKSLLLWLSGVFAALWALVNGLVYAFYKRGAFTAPDVPSPAGGG